MKKTYIIVAFTAALLACNSHSDHSSNSSETLDHAGHNKMVADTSQTTNGNTMKEIMNKMMQGMHGIKPIESNDVDFVRMMAMHHEGAVEMSKAEMNTGTDTALKAFAQTVISDQDKEIRFMESFVSKSPRTPSANTVDFQKALTNSMMSMMNETTAYNNIDKDYAALMIPHHQSAVDMAKAYLQYGKTKDLVTLCNNIVSSQTKEITWLNEWLSKHKG